jgi:hypothetical protein
MGYVVCVDDGFRDLSIAPKVLVENDGYLVEFSDSDYVVEVAEADDESDARLKISEITGLSEDELVTYTLQECKEELLKGARLNE